MKDKTATKIAVGTIGLVLLGYGAFWVGVLFIAYTLITHLAG